MHEIVDGVSLAVREAGYVWGRDEMERSPMVHVWRGPGRCEPVMFALQFVGLLPQSACHSGDGSDRLTVWCQYGDVNDQWLGMGDTMRTFSLFDPLMLDDLVKYLDFHTGNVHPVYGGESKVAREGRLRFGM